MVYCTNYSYMLYALCIYTHIRRLCYNYHGGDCMSGKNKPASINRYMQKTYDRLNVLVPKGKREIIKAAAAAAGESMNQYINTAIDRRLERETPAGADASRLGSSNARE